MKKLLLLGILLAIGTTSMAAGPDFINNGPANYKPGPGLGADFYNDFIPDITSNDDNQKSSRINRFLKEGKGRKDKEEMMIELLVHHPVGIAPEYKSIYGEGVWGDKLNFGDITFRVTGSMNADVKIKLEGDLFDTGMLKKATLKDPGAGVTDTVNSATKTLKLEGVVLGAGDGVPTQKDIELDLYFKLDTIGRHTGKIIAIAVYE